MASFNIIEKQFKANLKKENIKKMISEQIKKSIKQFK